jgi:hypothetical protein
VSRPGLADGPGVPVLFGSASLVFAFVLATSASAQGLGSAAAREKERREQRESPPARVLTNDDLPSEGEIGGETESAAGTDDEAAVTTSGPSPEPVDPVREELDREREKRALAEREWRARFAEARARVREAEARCWQEVVRTEFHQGIPVQMKVKEFVETEEYRQAKQGLADLQEEFRRTGLPPGWARE